MGEEESRECVCGGEKEICEHSGAHHVFGWKKINREKGKLRSIWKSASQCPRPRQPSGKPLVRTAQPAAPTRATRFLHSPNMPHVFSRQHRPKEIKTWRHFQATHPPTASNRRQIPQAQPNTVIIKPPAQTSPNGQKPSAPHNRRPRRLPFSRRDPLAYKNGATNRPCLRANLPEQTSPTPPQHVPGARA